MEPWVSSGPKPKEAANPLPVRAAIVSLPLYFIGENITSQPRFKGRRTTTQCSHKEYVFSYF
jgi:hypothetical protein